MLLKNDNILIINGIIKVIIVCCCAVFLAKSIWWLLIPQYSEAYVEKTSIKQFDNDLQFVINRYPFGVITKDNMAKPSLLSQLKLTGVYQSIPQKSLAFFDLNGKKLISKIGDTIDNNMVIKDINSNNVVVKDKSGENTIKISTSSNNLSGPNLPNMGSNNQYSNETDGSMYKPNSPTYNDNRNEDIQIKRRKLLEDYMSSVNQEKQ